METPAPKFTHGQDAGKVALALWLLVSPWMLNYSQVPTPVWNGDIVAVIVALSSIAAMLKFNKWEELISIVAGLWLAASPLILDYATLLPPAAAPPALERYTAQSALAASANHLGAGLAFVILSFWELNLWEIVSGKSNKAL